MARSKESDCIDTIGVIRFLRSVEMDVYANCSKINTLILFHIKKNFEIFVKKVI